MPGASSPVHGRAGVFKREGRNLLKSRLEPIGRLWEFYGGIALAWPAVTNRNLKPWESGAIPVSAGDGDARKGGAPAPVDFEDVEMDFDEDSIEYAAASPPPPPLDDAEDEGFEGDDDFEGVHTNVTNVNELKEWLVGGAEGPPPMPSNDAFDPEATSLVTGVDMGELLNAAQRSQPGERPAQSVDLPAAQGPSNFTVSGSLEAFQLGELLQLFATSRRTGALTLDHEGHQGRLFMNQGDVYAATWNGDSPHDPTDVMRRMARMKTGEFRFGPLTKEPPPVNVNMSMPQLLILLLGDVDDGGTQEIALDAPLQLADPITAPLRELSAEELDVMQLVHNDKTLEAAIPNAAMDADRLQEIVLALMERGYVKKLEFLDNEDEFFGGGLF